MYNCCGYYCSHLFLSLSLSFSVSTSFSDSQILSTNQLPPHLLLTSIPSLSLSLSLSLSSLVQHSLYIHTTHPSLFSVLYYFSSTFLHFMIWEFLGLPHDFNFHSF
ncbi:hypothetical protein Lalb_Chr15g0084671 [Lupinus albus]|uniref:Uncharacterized protein n=1 Tax=Lupinus albus TaxID=3870 RepID=A0A6A4PEM0_LUPAL|nr:hypothetical protein Lalb_Chr15g0084671 [Lupinus albus]